MSIKNKHIDQQVRHITKTIEKAIKTSITLIVITISILLFVIANKQIVTSIQEQVVTISKTINSTMTSYYDKIEDTLKILESDPSLLNAINDLNTSNLNSNNLLEVERQLNIITDNNKEIVEAYLISSKDKYLKLPKDNNVQSKITTTNLYREFIDSQGIKWTTPYIDTNENETFINVGFPIKQGILVKGVVVLKINFSDIADRVQNLNIGNNGFYSLISRPKNRSDFKVIHTTEGNVKPLIYLKNIVDSPSTEKDAPIKGLTALLDDANVNINVHSKLKPIYIGGSEYKVFVHEDQKLGVYKVIGIESKEFNKKSTTLLFSSIFISGTISLVSIFLLIRLLNKLSLMALIDPLTSLKNRRGVEEFLQTKENKPISVLLMDIDYFKKYNDNYGHLKGDEILKLVSTNLSKLTAEALEKDSFILARYGGEEFIIVVDDYNEEKTKLLASKIVELFNEIKIPHEYSEVTSHITLSIGLYSNPTYIPHEDAILYADEALYQSKKLGRNRWTHYNEF